MQVDLQRVSKENFSILDFNIPSFYIYKYYSNLPSKEAKINNVSKKK